MASPTRFVVFGAEARGTKQLPQASRKEKTMVCLHGKVKIESVLPCVCVCSRGAVFVYVQD